MKRFATIIYLGISALCAFAQANVQAKIDPMEILIGEQAQVTISVQAQENDKVEFPVLKSRQMLVPGVEVIDSHTGLTDPLNPSNLQTAKNKKNSEAGNLGVCDYYFVVCYATISPSRPCG